MIVNQKVKLKDTTEYGYILVPVSVQIFWEKGKQTGHAVLNELEFVGKRTGYSKMVEEEMK